MKSYKVINNKIHERVFFYLKPSESTVKCLTNYGERWGIDFIEDEEGWWAFPFAIHPDAVAEQVGVVITKQCQGEQE